MTIPKPRPKRYLKIQYANKNMRTIDFCADPSMAEKVGEFGHVEEINKKYSYYVKVSPTYKFQEVVDYLRSQEINEADCP